MPLYVLDTNTATLLRRNHPVVVARFRAVAPAVQGVAVITVEEQLSGWYTYLRKARRPQDVERAYRELAAAVRFYARVNILDFDAPAIARYQILVKQVPNVG